METIAQKTLESFRNIIVFRVEEGKDLLKRPLEYVVGDFDIAELKNFATLEDLVNAVDPHGEVTEAIGYHVYCEDLRNHFVGKQEGKPSALLLPLCGESGRRNFLCTIARENGYLNVMLSYLDKENGMLDFESYIADSFKDRLTGLFNYNTFLRHIKANPGKGFVCFLDLNKFKEVNDTFGHHVGDLVLQLTSSFMISIASKDVIFYRRSGDEFMIYFLDDDLSYAETVVNKIADYLENLPRFALKRYEGIVCGAAFGLVQLTKKVPYATAIKLADLAMYQAKKKGRRMHLIDSEDAEAIVAIGNLDARLQSLQKLLKRE